MLLLQRPDSNKLVLAQEDQTRLWNQGMVVIWAIREVVKRYQSVLFCMEGLFRFVLKVFNKLVALVRIISIIHGFGMVILFRLDLKVFNRWCWGRIIVDHTWYSFDWTRKGTYFYMYGQWPIDWFFIQPRFLTVHVRYASIYSSIPYLVSQGKVLLVLFTVLCCLCPWSLYHSCYQPPYRNNDILVWYYSRTASLSTAWARRWTIYSVAQSTYW
jgi:hypothetical protein